MGLSFAITAGLAIAVILRSESRGTHDLILLFQIRDSPNLEGQVPVFISPRNKVSRLYPQATMDVIDPASTRIYDSLAKKSESKLCHDLPSVDQSVLVSSTHLGLKTSFFISVRQLRVCLYGAPSLTRGRVCLLQCIMYNIFTFYMLLQECIYNIH
jgi:hypothetical protein